MTPEEIAAIIEDHKFPTLHAGETGINVITLQIWLRMLGFYQGVITGLLDAATAQAVDAFRAQQLAAGVVLEAPTGAVLKRDTWEAMNNLLQQRLPPDPSTLDRPPFPRRSSYDSEGKYRKALYEGLRAFGFPVKPAAEPLRLPLVINESGVAILHGLPPGSYTLDTLELGDTASPGRGSAEIHLANVDAAPVSGQVRIVRDGTTHSATVASGHALVNDLPPGDYQVIMEKVDTTNQIIDNTGSLEIRLFDANNLPVGGTAILAGETGDVASLRQTVRLFQALSRNIDRGLEPEDRSELGHNILTGEFTEAAHTYHELAWDSFNQTWGRFYGAPWMGIVFHPLDTEARIEQEGLNWGEHETMTLLYEWGKAYLHTSESKEDLEDRLRRPIAIRYITRSLGGRIDARTDFSQVGTEVSLHLPHNPESIVEGTARGQTYGGIDYDSSNYSTVYMETQLAAFASLYMGFGALCPDGELVDRLPWSDRGPFATRIVANRHPGSRVVNTVIVKVQPKLALDRSLISAHYNIRSTPNDDSPDNIIKKLNECSYEWRSGGISNKQRIGTKVWYYGSRLSPRGGWIVEDGMIGGWSFVPFQRWLDTWEQKWWKNYYTHEVSSEIQNEYPSFELATKMLRRETHTSKLPFELVIGSKIELTQLKYHEQIPFRLDVWQLGSDLKIVSLGKRKVGWLQRDDVTINLHHFLVGLDAVNEGGTDAVNRFFDVREYSWFANIVPKSLAELKIPLGRSYAAATWAGDLGSAATECFLDLDGLTSGEKLKKCPSINESQRRQHYYNTRVPNHELYGDILPLAILNIRVELRDRKPTLSWLFNALVTRPVIRESAFKTLCNFYRDQDNPRRVLPGDLLPEVVLFAFVWMLYRVGGALLTLAKSKIVLSVELVLPEWLAKVIELFNKLSKSQAARTEERAALKILSISLPIIIIIIGIIRNMPSNSGPREIVLEMKKKEELSQFIEICTEYVKGFLEFVEPRTGE